MYNWICEVIYLCKMQCGLTQPCRLYALCLITGITDIKCYWWFRFYTPVFCWRLSLKTKEAAGLKDRVASAWVWCVEGCRSAWVWCVEGRRWSRRKPLVWRAVSWVLECGVLKAVGEAEGSRWSEGSYHEQCFHQEKQSGQLATKAQLCTDGNISSHYFTALLQFTYVFVCVCLIIANNSKLYMHLALCLSHY